MEHGEIGDLLNFLRSSGHHDMADWVAITAVRGGELLADDDEGAEK
jgi:hypothetical protein